MLILHGCVYSARLIKREILQVLVYIDACTVNSNHVDVRIHTGALDGNDLPVDLNAPLINHNLRVPSRRDACLCEHFLQTDPVGVLLALLCFFVVPPVVIEWVRSLIGSLGALVTLDMLFTCRFRIRRIERLVLSLFRYAISASGRIHLESFSLCELYSSSNDRKCSSLYHASSISSISGNNGARFGSRSSESMPSNSRKSSVVT